MLAEHADFRRGDGTKRFAVLRLEVGRSSARRSSVPDGRVAVVPTAAPPNRKARRAAAAAAAANAAAADATAAAADADAEIEIRVAHLDHGL